MRCGAALIIYAVKERVDHDIAAVEPELCQEPLDAMTRDAYQDTADELWPDFGDGLKDQAAAWS